MSSEINFKPRSDHVVCRIVPVDQTRGLYMPQVSQEGKCYVVEAVGPDVKPDLKVGDRVLCTGMKGVDYDFLPNAPDLFIISDKNIVLIYDAPKTLEES